VKEHVRRLRLERAARRLKLGSGAIIDVALEAGYDSHEAFTRAFREVFGVPPSDWRADHPLETQTVEVSVVRVEAQGVVTLRHEGPYDNVGVTWKALSAQVSAAGLFGPWTRAVGICYDDPEITPAGKLRYEAAFVVPPGATSQLPSGDYIAALHRGPYHESHHTYAAMCGTWLRGKGRGIGTGPALEFYLNHPEHTAPADLLTQICLPLE
jgi:AraC family transcriptional regulator